MKTLHLTIKKKWFLMVDAGEKPEEYRDESDWIRSRLLAKNGEHRKYDAVCFTNGYAPDSPRVTRVYNGFEFREGRQEWGAEPGKKYFVIKLGEKL